jgi:hypothetical protein
MRIVNFVLAVMFLVFASLQLNDSNDVIIWILIYGIMAVTCVLAAFEIYSSKAIIALLAIFFIYSLTYWSGMMDWFASPDRSLLFDDLAKMQYPYIEAAREFLGLWICIAVLGFYLYRARKRGPIKTL